MKYSAFLLLLGIMMGQEKPPEISTEPNMRFRLRTPQELNPFIRQVTIIVADFNADGTAIVGGPTCDDKITFGQTTKLVRDIFPEECGQEKPLAQGGSDRRVLPFVTFQTPSQKATPEPIDVPAIGKSRTSPTCNTTILTDDLAPYRRPICLPDAEDYWTCEDQTRILEHDEQTPPKWYCRKAQTE